MSKKHDLSLLWTIALAAREYGDDVDALAKAVGIAPNALEALLADWEPLAQSLAAGVDSRRLAGNSPQDKILASLSPDAKQIWEDISDMGTERQKNAQALLAQNGAAVRQKLLVLGLMETGFQVNKVLKMLQITKKELDTWTRDYPEFQELLTEVQWARKQMAEDALFQLVKEGSEKATIFLNQTLNKETYGNEVKISGEITQAAGVLDLAALGLPFELEKQILAHIQGRGVTDSDGTLITGPS